MEVFLVLNGFELNADVDTSESMILDLAAGRVPREELHAWIASSIVAIEQ